MSGWLLVLLCIGSIWIPKVLGWKEKVVSLTPLMRELFWTYSLYIWASHIFFAVMALTQTDWFLSGSPAAASLAGFICLWWSVRLYLQFFGFDFDEVGDCLANKVAKHLLTLLFIGLVFVFGMTVAWNLGWLGNGVAL
ncbi:hypothetical protein N9F48_04090 [Akkermansiaceae bacterium]|nr:hypothetical protein [Akkermansiaceae bacterium]MDB4429840.1 hypothetical protein [Akkermansiaceae bacterium]MDB4562325.1 hypothetical protein [Akkermansiaceae bacterium]MDB4725698.1 hypothetical protein [Akkermansiaceae bacterium]